MNKCLIPWVLAWASFAALAAPEVLVGSRALTDLEFDSGRDGVYCAACNGGAGNARFVHVSKRGEMWVGNVDPLTGDFVQHDGRGVLVDVNVSAAGSSGATSVGNGPEWVYSIRGSELVYTRWADGTTDEPQNRSLGFARFAQGSWVAGPVADTSLRQNPGGSLDLDDASPLAVYTNTNRDTMYWRGLDATGAGVETAIPLRYPAGTPVTRRFVPGTRWLVLTAPAPAAGRLYRQVFLYRPDTLELQQLTFDPADKFSSFMWRAPEFDNRLVFFTVAANTDIRIYRKLSDDPSVMDWELVNTVVPGGDMRYIGSPEYFTHNGKSWIYFWTSTHPTRSTTPTRIMMTGIEPQTPSLTTLASDTDGVPRSRRDPEHYITAQGPVLYYMRSRLRSAATPMTYEGIHRVDTGLGPRVP